MNDSPNANDKLSDTEISVRYSAKFLAEKKRKDRRVALYSGPLLMSISIAMVVNDINAIRRHEMIHTGPRNGLHIISPWFELPIGLLGLYFGIVLLCGYFKDR